MIPGLVVFGVNPYPGKERGWLCEEKQELTGFRNWWKRVEVIEQNQEAKFFSLSSGWKKRIHLV